MVPLVADTGIAASNYRFRLQPLCRLAAQCGVAEMDKALQSVTRGEFDDGVRNKLHDDEGDIL